MSTLSERVRQIGVHVESFRYPSIHAAAGVTGVAPFGAEECYKARDYALQQEIAAAVEAARQQGFRDGQAQAEAAAAEALAQLRSAVEQAVSDFGTRQAEYFRRVESEAVRLALAVARKVLHREVQMDPLLLAGVVRVALDQVREQTRVVLRTAPEAARLWAEHFAKDAAQRSSLEVVPDPALGGHQCVLQTELGSTALSVDAQMNEIESGFFDLLKQAVEAHP